MAVESARSSAEEEGDEGTVLTPHVAAPWIYRGKDIGRTLAFSDGIFAFAATLLVLGLVLPANAHGTALRSYLFTSSFAQPLFAYVITFLVISIWWRGHHLVFSYLAAYDRVLVQMNAIFLLCIAILPFATLVLTAAGSDPIGVIFFDITQIAAAATLLSIWAYASGRGRLVPPRFDPIWRRVVATGIITPALVFAVSLPVALVSTNLAEILWVGVFGVPMLTRALGRRSESSP
ncbi:MAG: DUF1211 domain-containing protein [Thermoplasmata archaeon]|nr:DUF1211 domain-containing protein [Thermoplasmata archaeon]